VTVRMGALCFLRNFECQKRSIVRDWVAPSFEAKLDLYRSDLMGV
jgi:hypothetical protein